MGVTVNRLILRGATTAFAMFSILSCSDATAPDGITTDDLSIDASRIIGSIDVTLTSRSIGVGDTTRATAAVFDRQGRPLNRLVNWRSGDSTIATVSSSGLVTGIAAGSAEITAYRNGHNGSATVTVAPPGTQSVTPVASVSVTLAASTLTVGQSTQASATTRDSSGNVLTGRTIAWGSSDSTVAMISSAGLVTALKNGPARIIGTSENKSGSAPVTVQDTATPPPPPPPPPPPSSWTPNEPTGMTMLTDRAFNAMNESGWSDEHGGSGGGFAITQDPEAPRSPAGVLRATYPAGYTSIGDGPGDSDFDLATRPRTVYVSWWIRVSSNFYGHEAAVNKEWYLWSGNTPLMYFDASCQGTGPITPRIALQDTKSNGTSDLAPNLVPSARMPRGQWVHFEAVVVGNTAGVKDGSVDWWMNGQHIGSYTLQWTTGATTWNIFHLSTIWGGSGGPSLPVTMTVDWDHAYISGKN